MALSNNQKIGLIVVGASALLLFKKSNSEQKPIISGGGGGGFIIPMGFGSSEITNPNSTSPTYPDINIYESNDFDKDLPTSNAPPTESKKSSSSRSSAENLLKTQYHTDSEGNLIGVTDSIFTPNPQCRLPTASDKLNYAISSGGSVPNTPTKKESTPSKPSSFWGKVGGAIGSVVKRGIFI